jgi:prepilin signal peptidase PulO-like enzyme (type II secretory pathway)
MPEPKQEKRINPLYPIAWCAFLCVPAYAFYAGWKSHSVLALVASGLAILGFVTLIIMALKHNRRLARQKPDASR